MSELEVKKAHAEKLRQEIRVLEEKERIEKEWPEWKERGGTFWKFRNSYSCPKDDSDFWWKYLHISNVTQDGLMDTLEFQIDKDGRLTVQEQKRIRWNLYHGYVPATAEEWHEAARVAEAIAAKLLFT